MGERKINPKFNVNKIYKTVNIINPYRFSGGGVTNLISNGDFSSGTTDWFAARGRSTLSVVSGYGRCTNDTTASFGIAHDPITLSVGLNYDISFDYDCTNANGTTYARISADADLSSGSDIALGNFASGTSGSLSTTFTANDATSYFGLVRLGSTIVNEYIEITNVVLTEA